MTLAEYLKTAGRGAQSRLAEQVGVSVPSVWRWKEGVALPSLSRIPAIERATGGMVTAADFMPSGEGA